MTEPDLHHSDLPQPGLPEPDLPQPEPSEVTDLNAVALGLLRDAANHPARRAARTVVASTRLRATVIALLSGAELAEHASPPAATLHVLAGQVRLRWATRELTVDAGQVVRIPAQRHSLVADLDSAVLLTVALN